MTFRVNLFNDFCEHAKQWVRQNVDSGNLRIKNLNRSCAEVADWIDKHAVSAIFEIESQLLAKGPRQVRFSPDFECPADLQADVGNLKNLIEKGEDLSPFLGNNLERPGSHDMMLAKWGVWHLRLKPKGSRRSGRDNNLLFAWFSDTEAYLIAMGKHEDLGNVEYLKALQRNYPQALGPEIDSAGIDVESEAYKEVWCTNVNSALKIKGRSYFCPRGGCAADGTSMLAIRNRMILQRRLENASQLLMAGLGNALKSFLLDEVVEKIDSGVYDVKLHKINGDEIQIDIQQLGIRLSLLDNQGKIAMLKCDEKLLRAEFLCKDGDL